MSNNYQNSYQQNSNDYYNYYDVQYNQTASSVLRNKMFPITLSWYANAWVKNKLSLKEKIVSRFSSDDDSKYKQILTNGKIKLINY